MKYLLKTGLMVIVPAVAVLGCAHRPPESNVGSSASGLPQNEAGPERSTLSLNNVTTGEVVRRLGREDLPVSVALAYGLQERPLDSFSLVRAAPSRALEKLAEQANLARQHCAGYDFLYAPGYEPLTQIQLSAQLHPRYSEKVDALVFGAGVPLYVVFAWLGQGLGVTVVADDAVSQAACGEVALSNVSIEAGLEAILKSARVARFKAESTSDYVFFYAAGRPVPPTTCLNRRPLLLQDMDRLKRRVDLYLPEPPRDEGALQTAPEAQTLESLLPEISRQLGIRVVAEPTLADVPVNPVAMSGLPLETTLDLLVRRWLTDDLGWQLTRDRIVLRRRTRMDTPALEPSPPPRLE